jgi:hypothetical protein
MYTFYTITRISFENLSLIYTVTEPKRVDARKRPGLQIFICNLRSITILYGAVAISLSLSFQSISTEDRHEIKCKFFIQ